MMKIILYVVVGVVNMESLYNKDGKWLPVDIYNEA
jgi:hypothetical protein